MLQCLAKPVNDAAAVPWSTTPNLLTQRAMRKVRIARDEAVTPEPVGAPGRPKPF